MRIIYPLLSLFLVTGLLSAQSGASAAGMLKYVVYDFDGLNVGASNLPDGDFGNNDLSYAVAANPLAASEVIGDRVLRLDLNWQLGLGQFGKATMRYLELNRNEDKLNFYIYNPVTNSGNALVRLIITEDDNGNNQYENSADDKWTFDVSVSPGGGWQLISAPLSAFQDDNAGGNGNLDAGFTGAGGMLLSVNLEFSKQGPPTGNDTYYIDMLCFSDGDLPVGASILDLPATGGEGCALGALTAKPSPDQTPQEVHAYLPQGKKISFVNWFVYYAQTGTVANEIPGPEVQNLLDNGYQPIITWEMMYAAYSRLDPVQPRLDAILNGSFDSYIDAFASKIKSYNGPVILRIFHEFEGDWYSWSVTQNGNDAGKYIAAYRHVVDRFRALGANNVKWMWCLNAEPKPYVAYNWVVSAYPGDSYVDIVATDIYNHPDLGQPDWKSFRYTMAESYYYLVKYFSHKPLYVCEVGSRERNGSEPPASQSKAGWICSMSRDLKTYFNRTRALVFFSLNKEHDWRINSSTAALDAFTQCIWNDGFYGAPVGLLEDEANAAYKGYPNPFSQELKLIKTGLPDTGKSYSLQLYDMSGRVLRRLPGPLLPEKISTADLPQGVYILEISNGTTLSRQKLLKLPSE